MQMANSLIRLQFISSSSSSWMLVHPVQLGHVANLQRCMEERY